MSQPTAIDCQSFAGGFTLGMARAGFNVIEKREGAAGFGVPIVDYNRDLINPDLNIETGEPETWRPRKADVVFGNPPCSAFTGMLAVRNLTGGTWGADNKVNDCMWDMVAYAAKCRADIVIMESVQNAYKMGRELMQDLRFDMEERTGRPYDLIHVLHNNASVGGASIRPRYFMVLARPGLKFGIEPPIVDHVPSLSELLYDIETLPEKTEPQKYKRKAAGQYAASLRSPSGMVDMVWNPNRPENKATAWIMSTGAEWKGGEHIGDAMRRAIEIVGFDAVPDWMKYHDGEEIKKLWLTTNAYSPRRWYADKAAGVIMQYATRDFIHPTQPRVLQLREAARVMGFPDDWSLKPMLSGSVNHTQRWLGKGISVPCGEWIGGWAKRALDRDPGPWRGRKLEKGEWVIDVTNDYKAVYDFRTGEKRDARSRALVKEMEAREY